MCEEMGLTHLQQILRSFCFKSEWKYAVFWKLKHRARMMLTWEDAYYANQETFDQSDQMTFNDNSLDNLRDGHCLQDTLGLAVAKMSYLVYSLGEGIIGQVAVTGKHQWIFADKPTSRCWSSSEFCDGWQTQFSAGIKTIAVVAVVPHGVVQLGSLHTIAEDVKLVTHIKDVFYALQNSAMRYISYQIPYTTQSSSCLSEVSAKFSGSEVINNFPLSSDNVPRSQRKIDPQSYSLPLPGTSNDEPRDFHSLPGAHQKKAVEVVNEYVGVEKIEMRNHENTDFLHAQSVVLNSEKENRGKEESSNKENSEEANIGCWTLPVHPRLNNASIPCNHTSEKQQLDSFTSPLAEFVTYPSFPITVIDSADRGGIKFGGVAPPLKEELPLPNSFDIQINEAELSCVDTVSSSLKFSAGCELYEALGPCIKKQLESCSWDESERAEAKAIKPLERTASSLFIDCEPDYLLEAVVANSCILSNNAKGDSSLCKSAESLLTTGKTQETSNHVKHGSILASKSSVHTALSAGDAHNNLKRIWDSTEGCNVRSSKDSSSKTISASSKHSEMQTEPSKVNRKRARPGESCRPRPRDRQLIQDRVKELRELVPNGSKCSIDSLLERTIKHMFFLQSVTKHADKLRKCAESKFRDNKRSLRGSSSHEHGSSWALDVGGQADICPLVVENLNMDGQMLVEMLCEECGRFLEIAEAIKSLGLTILKGVTEARGENIWACFVVEGQNNRAMHRMDVLWSLMQLLQPKTTT